MVAARGRKRSALTDDMRAKVFIRDRATCAFSGISLWLLDYGAAPGEEDWPDHILPVARKGTNDLDNLVCASAEYNFAKRVNTTSNLFLYRSGLPTSAAYELFARIPEHVRAKSGPLQAIDGIGLVLQSCNFQNRNPPWVQDWRRISWNPQNQAAKEVLVSCRLKEAAGLARIGCRKWRFLAGGARFGAQADDGRCPVVAPSPHGQIVPGRGENSG